MPWNADPASDGIPGRHTWNPHMNAANPQGAKRSATIYRCGAHFFALPSSRTTDGLWISTEPVLKLDERASDEDLVSIIQRSLELSRLNGPHPADWARALAPLLDQAEVKSWSTFVRGASCVTIDADDGGNLTVIPMENGSRGEFRGHLSSSLSFKIAEGKELGAAVRKLLT